MVKRCPLCKRSPETVKTEMNEGYITACTTEGCRCALCAIGKTRYQSETCWDNCIKRRDY